MSSGVEWKGSVSAPRGQPTPGCVIVDGAAGGRETYLSFCRPGAVSGGISIRQDTEIMRRLIAAPAWSDTSERIVSAELPVGECQKWTQTFRSRLDNAFHEQVAMHPMLHGWIDRRGSKLCASYRTWRHRRGHLRWVGSSTACDEYGQGGGCSRGWCIFDTWRYSFVNGAR